MKSIKTIAAALIVATAAFASVAQASVGWTTSSATIRVSVQDGVATLYGHVDNNFERKLAEREAAQIEGVDEVRNLITY